MKTKEEKKQIALDTLSMTFRDVSEKHGVSLCMIHKNFRKHLFSFFHESEVYDGSGKVKDIEELREIFNKYRVPKFVFKNKNLTKEERILANIKLLKERGKMPSEIINHLNLLGVKLQGENLTVTDIIEA